MVSAALIAGGKASDVVLDDLVEIRVPGYNINIGRDDGGLFAMSANCTHAHCVLVFQSDTPPPSFLCTCHGSTFDYYGQNPTAPAPSPLDHYKLIIDGAGNLSVDTGTVVPATTRTAG